MFGIVKRIVAGLAVMGAVSVGAAKSADAQIGIGIYGPSGGIYYQGGPSYYRAPVYGPVYGTPWGGYQGQNYKYNNHQHHNHGHNHGWNNGWNNNNKGGWNNGNHHNHHHH